MNQPSREARASVVVAVLLGLAILAVYSSTYHFGLVNFDDEFYLADRATVATGLTPSNIAWAFTTFDFGNYHPLTWISYQLDATLWGQNYGRYHLTNALLHALTSGLLLWFLRLATGSFWRSAAVAAIFALHPARVESVAWISERKDLLSGAFGIASLIAYAYYARKPHSVGGFLRMAAATLLLALGMLSKAMLVTWPAVMLLMDVWPLRRIGNFASKDASIPACGLASAQAQGVALSVVPPATLPRLLLEKIPLFAVSLAISLATLTAQQAGNAVISLERYGVLARISSALLSYVRYLGLLFFPTDLAALYLLKPVPAWQAIGSAAILLTITFFAIRFRKEKPYLLIGWLWFLGTLVPVIGLVQTGSQAIADRYSYLPHIGLLVAFVWLVADSVFILRCRRAAAALTVILLLALGVASWRQSQYWRDSVTLWTRVYDVTTDNLAACDRLAGEYINNNQPELAVKYVVDAARIQPTKERQDTAGTVLMVVRRYAEAAVYFRLMSEDKQNPPGTYGPQMKLIRALRLAGQNEEAQRVLDKLLADPAVPRLLVEAELNLPGAIAQYRAHIAANPRDAVARNVLGVALAQSGDLAGAIEQFRAALAINPGMTDAKANLERATGLMKK